jgi:hypothetical protein
MASLAPEFEVVSMDDQYGCNDWANSNRHLGLLIDESMIGKRFKDMSESVDAIK